jgi:hypothetical protein
MKDKLEELYNVSVGLQTQINNHGWSRQQTRYDAEFIASVSKSLLSLSNSIYNFREEYKQALSARDKEWREKINYLIACSKKSIEEWEVARITHPKTEVDTAIRILLKLTEYLESILSEMKANND